MVLTSSTFSRNGFRSEFTGWKLDRPAPNFKARLFWFEQNKKKPTDIKQNHNIIKVSQQMMYFDISKYIWYKLMWINLAFPQGTDEANNGRVLHSRAKTNFRFLCVRCIQCIRRTNGCNVFNLLDLLYIRETYILYSWLIRQRKRKSGRSLKIGVLMAKYNLNCRIWQKYAIFCRFLRSFCTGHFVVNLS